MNKIKINKIDKEVYKQPGFPTGPFDSCLHCHCGVNGLGGTCCWEGADIDKEAYDLIIENKDELEKRIGQKISECFEKEWLEDTDFLGGKGIATKTKNNTCIFRVSPKRGCEIIKLVVEKKLPRRMIPSTCRIYPLTWDEGRLFVREIEPGCVCLNLDNKIKKSIFESQKSEIDDIFSFN
jgi:hypothetical protein